MSWGLGFLAAGLAVLYPLAIYPLLVVLAARLRPRPWQSGTVKGKIAHVITVYNEETRIREKLLNSLAVAPEGREFEILVASDGSDDGTERIVAEFADRGVRWLPFARRGKEQAQRDAIAATDAPWIVFSDASTRIEKHAIEKLLEPFADARVGAVSGTDLLDVSGESTGEDLYVRYEMAVRRSEARAGSLVGLSGCFFAARREVAEEILPDVPSDMGTALISIARGGRAVVVDDAVALYAATREAGREFRRKKRTALRGIRGIFRYRRALSWRRPLMSWQILSHKWMRFLAPFFTLAAAVALVGGWWSGELWAVWLAPVTAVGFVAALLAMWTASGLNRFRLLRVASFFLLVNGALLAAWWAWLRGGRDVVWTPTARV